MIIFKTGALFIKDEVQCVDILLFYSNIETEDNLLVLAQMACLNA